MCFVCIVPGYILYNSASDKLDEATDVLLSTLLIMITLALLLLFVVMAILNIRKMLRERQRKRSGTADQSENRVWEEEQEVSSHPFVPPLFGD